ncbi:MAG: hypothetical protein ACT6RF_09185 [Allorhizobium sp.]|uniref:hypothetical protein n=1 Tax=Allorhizobium sp. TaxID=633478 RepID=UPI0040331695
MWLPVRAFPSLWHSRDKRCRCGVSRARDPERESEEDRTARLARIAEAEVRAAAERDKKEKAQNDFRQREISQARGLWLNAVDCRLTAPDATEGARLISSYAKARTGFDPSGAIFDHIRFSPRATYWHGQDEAGRVLALYTGPALVAPIVDAMTRQITGSQTIWIDLSVKPKRRPVLWGLTSAGRKAGFAELDEGGVKIGPREERVAAGYYERISSKKMRGHKKGGVIPVAGDPAAARWLGGEGIETTLAIAGSEGFRDDTFYFSAGDIGNMAGPADKASDFNHPTLTVTDARDRRKPVRVKGPVPKHDSAGEAMMIPDHVTELVLIADGDSEPVATASAMARARARHGAGGRLVDIAWPPAGMDFADAMAAAMHEGEDA